MSVQSPTTTALPSRTGTVMTQQSTRSSDDDAIPTEDATEVTKLFHERLAAWRALTSHLEDYIEATGKLHRDQAKDYEKLVKSVSKPIKHHEQFDQNVGGINGFLDNLRTNTQTISNSNEETSKTLKGSVVPVFERLEKEIKAKSKELLKGAGKGGKAVDKARSATQKHIESLGQATAVHDSRGGKITANDDPYILRRGIVHRLNKQLIEENANRQDLLAVQNNFASFEAHIVQTIQNGLGQFNTIVSKQADITKNLYGDIVGNAQRIPGEFEWIKFLERNSEVLIDPSAQPRDIANISFPNQTHRATVPLISGSLERKSKVLRRYEQGYYVVTPSKFLHEFKTDDDIAKDPVPEVSIYLPDCTVGQALGEKFVIKGKDSSKGPMGMSLHSTHEYNFKAHTAADALKWWEIIREAAGQVTNEGPSVSTPTSPISPSTGAGAQFGSVHQQPQEVGTTVPAVAGAGATTSAVTHPTAAEEKAALAANQGHPATTAAPSGVAGTAPTSVVGTAHTTGAVGTTPSGVVGTSTVAPSAAVPSTVQPTSATHHPAATSAEPPKY